MSFLKEAMRPHPEIGKTLALRTAALGRFRDEAARDAARREALEHAMHTDPSVLVRHEAARHLARLALRGSVPALARCLRCESQHTYVRREAARGLGAAGDVGAVSALAEVADNEAQPEALRDACNAARRRLQRGEAASADATNTNTARFPLLADTDATMAERYGALLDLRAMGGPACVSPLAAGLLPDAGVLTGALLRAEVAHALGRTREPAAVEPLAACLAHADEDARVRVEAAEALAIVSTPNAVDALQAFASDDDAEVRDAVQRLLAR